MTSAEQGGNIDRFSLHFLRPTYAASASSTLAKSSGFSAVNSGSGTLHVLRPGARARSSGSGTRRATPSPSTVATTASSSIGLRLQVEYTRRPPGLRSCNPRLRHFTCVACRPSAVFTDHNLHGLARPPRWDLSFRSVPSPLHGASQRTRSKRILKPPRPFRNVGYTRASLKVISKQCLTCFLIRLAICIARSRLVSFATKRPEGNDPGAASANIMSNNCPVFEPGAAHMSSTRWCWRTSNNRGGRALFCSCRSNKPMAWAASKPPPTAPLAALLPLTTQSEQHDRSGVFCSDLSTDPGSQ
mmetsp:Transcript_166968/g.531013  ORF Transcript_166968/g.531013 Transcript_166968/m.531013 type:complete len:301 (-) Transcript_166968:365-1267(-)